MKARTFLIFIVASPISLVACANILGLTEDPSPIGELTERDSSTDSAPLADASLNDSAPNACAADLQNDVNHCGACGHSCQGNACTAGECAPSRLAAVASPTGFAVQGTTIYYTNGGNILSANVDGSSIQTVATTGFTSHLHMIARESFVAWSNDNQPGVVAGSIYAKEPDKPIEIVKATNLLSYVYEMTFASIPGANHSLAWLSDDHRIGYSLPDSGGTPSSFAYVEGAKNAPCSTLLGDGDDIFLSGKPPSGLLHFRGAAGDAPQVLVPGRSPCALAVDATSLYFSDPFGIYALRRVGIAPASEPTEICAEPTISAIVLDGESVYSISYPDGSHSRVAKCSIAGGQTKHQVLVGANIQSTTTTPQNNAKIYVDDAWVYYMNYGMTELFRIPK